MRQFALFAPILGLVVCNAQPALAQSPAAAATPVCIYQNRTYSVGAAICPQARLMLSCSQESDKLMWKIVSDPALANLCTAPTVTADRPARRRHAVRIRAPAGAAARAAAQVTPATSTPRCFVFNNKRYCE